MVFCLWFSLFISQVVTFLFSATLWVSQLQKAHKSLAAVKMVGIWLSEHHGEGGLWLGGFRESFLTKKKKRQKCTEKMFAIHL